ncbi:hypothetical protein [Clostridium perfringens]
MKNEKNKEVENKEVEDLAEIKECFVIMPISDSEGYEKGHFKRVYDLIIKPGVKAAGFEPYRADDNDSSRLIHIDIIKKLIEAPMAICDLTTRNPNVLYELGIRQAFDKPVFIIQESGTERIFDINGISTLDYEKGFDYENVISAQNNIKEGVKSTFCSSQDNFNSLISLMKINAAMIPTKEDISDISDNSMFKLILNQISSLDKKITEAFNRDTLTMNTEKESELSKLEKFITLETLKRNKPENHREADKKSIILSENINRQHNEKIDENFKPGTYTLEEFMKICKE